MTPRLALALLAALAACRDEPPATPDAATSVVAAPPPAADAGPLAALEREAKQKGTADAWIAYGDALAEAGDRDGAVKAYELCALAAGEDFERSLYCQAASAVAKSVKEKRDR